MNTARVRLLRLLLLVAGVLAVIPAQAQVAFRAAGAQVVTTGASLVPVIPAGTQAGDVAVLVVAGRPTDTSEPAAPSGWTLRSSILREIGARDLKVVTYYRVLAGGDANPTLTVPSGWQGTQAGISGQIAVWSGVNTATPFDVADVTGNSATTSPWTPPGITTVTAGARVVSAVASGDDNALGFTSAQGFTLRMSGAAYDTTTGGDHSVGVADKDQPTAGAVTMPGWSQTVNASDAWVGISFALKPANVPVALYFIHPDHLNTPRLIANGVGQTVWRWDNDDPFGNNAPNENPSGLGNFTCNLRFPGQYYDQELNTHQNYFRDYDPAIGRYIQSDPIGLAGGINTYLYSNDPTSETDPLGLSGQQGAARTQRIKYMGPGRLDSPPPPNPFDPLNMSVTDCKQECALKTLAISGGFHILPMGLWKAELPWAAYSLIDCFDQCDKKSRMCTPFRPIPFPAAGDPGPRTPPPPYQNPRTTWRMIAD